MPGQLALQATRELRLDRLWQEPAGQLSASPSRSIPSINESNNPASIMSLIASRTADPPPCPNPSPATNSRS
jgi:hypothetical protein